MRIKNWSDKGIWADLFERVKVDPDMEANIINTTLVYVRACSADYNKDSQDLDALESSRGGFTTKIEQLESSKSIAVILSRKNRKYQKDYDRHIYKERYLIEYFFRKIKHFRLVFSRFDEIAPGFMSFL